MTDQGGRLRLAALLLGVAVLASSLLGFLRDSYIAAAFGANGATDAFIAAFTIPDMLMYLVAGGTLSSTFVPIYTRHLTAGTAEEADRVFSSIATLMSIVLLVGIVTLYVGMPTIAHAYLRKLKADDLDLAIGMSRVLLPATLAFYLGSLAAATLMSRQRFVAAAVGPLVYNVGTIAGGLILGHSLGTPALAWGALGGAVLGPMSIQVVAAARAGLRYAPRLDLKHPDVRMWIRLSLPLMIGVSLVTADEWIMRYFAAGTVGAISLLSYGRKLVRVPIMVAGQAIGQASMPFFARLVAEGRRAELGALVGRSARGSAVIAALAGGALAALAVPTVDLLFRRGRFSEADVVPTALYVALFAVVIPLWGMQGIIARAFYATSDTLTPMIAGTVVTIVTLPIYWLMHRSFGSIGLVIASDLGILAHTAALLVLVHRPLPELDRAALLIGVGRGFLVAGMAAVPAYAVARWLPVGHLAGHTLDLVRIGAGGLVFLALALALAGPLGVPEAKLLLARVRARFAAKS